MFPIATMDSHRWQRWHRGERHDKEALLGLIVSALTLQKELHAWMTYVADVLYNPDRA
jgi:hypothetical protein